MGARLYPRNERGYNAALVTEGRRRSARPASGGPFSARVNRLGPVVSACCLILLLLIITCYMCAGPRQGAPLGPCHDSMRYYNMPLLSWGRGDHTTAPALLYKSRSSDTLAYSRLVLVAISRGGKCKELGEARPPARVSCLTKSPRGRLVGPDRAVYITILLN